MFRPDRLSPNNKVRLARTCSVGDRIPVAIICLSSLASFLYFASLVALLSAIVDVYFGGKLLPGNSHKVEMVV